MLKCFAFIVFICLSGTTLAKDKDCHDSPAPDDLSMCHRGCNDYYLSPLQYSCISKAGNIACKCVGYEIVWFKKKFISAAEAIKVCDEVENCRINITEE